MRRVSLVGFRLSSHDEWVVDMAQKWVDVTSTATVDRLGGLAITSVHLSDGTLVELEYDGSANVLLVWSADHVTTTQLASLATSSWLGTGLDSLSLCRDFADNIYVVGADATTTSTIKVACFTKNAGYSWTAQTVVTGTGTIACLTLAAVWCNTGGGTSSKGHIMVVGTDQNTALAPFYKILDAGVCIAGTGTLVTASGTSPTFTGATAVSGIVDISADGVGATSGLALVPRVAGSLATGAWGVNSSGALSTNTALANQSATATAPQRNRLIRIAPNRWLTLTNSQTTSGQYKALVWQASGAIGVAVMSGSPTNMPLNGAHLSWDAFADPVVPGQVWIIALAAQSGGQQQVWRLLVTTPSDVPTFAAAAVTDDLLTNASVAVADDIRVVKEPVGTTVQPRPVDWQVWVKSSGTQWSLDGDYTLFLPPPRLTDMYQAVNRAGGY